MTSDGRSPANSLCNGMASISARRRCATGWRKQGYGGVQPRKLGQAHSSGPRRSGFGEFVQWDTSTHAWLEGQGEAVRYRVRMIGNATSRSACRFVLHDGTCENMGCCRSIWSAKGGSWMYDGSGRIFTAAARSKRSAQQWMEADRLTQIGGD